MASARRGRGRPRTRPEVLRADKAYCSRGHRALLRSRGIKAVIPEKSDQAAHRKRRGSAGGLFSRTARYLILPSREPGRRRRYVAHSTRSRSTSALPRRTPHSGKRCPRHAQWAGRSHNDREAQLASQATMDGGAV